MLESRPLLTGDVNEARELISLGIMTSAVAQEDLDHAWVIPRVVARPWRAVLHDPAFGGHFHGFRYQCIDPNFEFFILPLLKTELTVHHKLIIKQI